MLCKQVFVTIFLYKNLVHNLKVCFDHIHIYIYVSQTDDVDLVTATAINSPNNFEEFCQVDSSWPDKHPDPVTASQRDLFRPS